MAWMPPLVARRIQFPFIPPWRALGAIQFRVCLIGHCALYHSTLVQCMWSGPGESCRPHSTMLEGPKQLQAFPSSTKLKRSGLLYQLYPNILVPQSYRTEPPVRAIVCVATIEHGMLSMWSWEPKHELFPPTHYFTLKDSGQKNIKWWGLWTWLNSFQLTYAGRQSRRVGITNLHTRDWLIVRLAGHHGLGRVGPGPDTARPSVPDWGVVSCLC